MPEPNTIDLEVRALLREQQALRREIDRLLQQQQELLEAQRKNGGGKDGGGKEEGDKKEAGEKEGGEKEAGEKKEEKKEEPKPPFKERALGWARAHPVGLVLLIAGVLALLTGGYLLLQYLSTFVSTDDAQIDGHIHQIGARISGTVQGVYTENNRSVVQNQTLIDLDPRDYQTALAQAQANLAQAESALAAESPNVPITRTTEKVNVATANLEIANAEAALQAARQNYQSAVSDVRQAEVNARNAETQEVRYRHLADKQEVSRELYDQKATEARSQEELVASRRAVADAAQKAVEQREAVLAQARARAEETSSNEPREVAVQHANVSARRANVEAARAQVAQARLNLSYCKILAPVPGIVGDRTVEVGQQVAPGQELLAITSVDDLWVTANFKETQITQMHPGQAVTVTVDALGLKFNGYVQNMAGATGARYSLLPPENATGNYVKVVQRLPVRIRFKPNQYGMDGLRPGMSVEPKVWVK